MPPTAWSESAMSDEITKAVYQRSQIGHRVGFGERPALIVVDFSWAC